MTTELEVYRQHVRGHKCHLAVASKEREGKTFGSVRCAEAAVLWDVIPLTQINEAFYAMMDEQLEVKSLLRHTDGD